MAGEVLELLAPERGGVFVDGTLGGGGHSSLILSKLGEGGRLFYMDGDRKVFFMEDKYGPRGNLMTRDLISREIVATGRDVLLDISFMDRKLIDSRLPEVRDICSKYRGIDISKEPLVTQNPFLIKPESH